MRLLVVEDYAPLRKSISRGLKDAGFAVDSTGDGEEGLWYAQSYEYDALILDVMLPTVDGLTLLRRLREKGQDTHVLILTAKGELEDRLRGLNLGADDYMVKPFAFEELLARVRALVRRAYKAKNPLLRVADLTVDTRARTAHRGRRALDLTAREYALLEFMALRAGEVVTRSDIWEHLYEQDTSPDSNVVEVYIGYLRRKLERDGASRLIHTRRGQGYVLGGPE